jgi:putative transposase
LYLTNLTDEQWQLLYPVFEITRAQKIGGRSRSYPFREIVNAILYITKTGCQWRMLPTAAIIDAQSIKTTGPGRQRGFDAGKKIKERKRHIAVDTMGNLLAVCVHSAGIQDRRGARLLMIRLYAMFAALSIIWADGGYSGVLVEWTKNMFNWNLTIVKRTDAMRGKFVVLPRRWGVERSFAWLGNSRRLSKDYERLPDTAEVFIKITEVHRLLRGIC